MKENNNAHLHGYVNGVRTNDFENGKKSFLIDLTTIEAYKDNAGESKRIYTNHKVNLVTDDAKLVKALEAVKADVENNFAHRGEEDFKPKTHTATVDGKLVARINQKDGNVYFNNLVVTTAEDFKLDAKLGEGEVRNFAEIKGNIVNVNMFEDDGFAIVRVGAKYYAPGESVNYKGETKPYTEMTTFLDTRINANRLPKTFDQLKNGELEVGDLISVRGQMHNNDYQDKNEVNQRKITIDLNKVELVAKKGQKKAEAEEKKEEKTEAKKAAPKQKKATARKKGVSM